MTCRQLLIVSLILLCAAATADGQRLAGDMAGLKPGTKVDVIIQFVNPGMEQANGHVAGMGGQKKADLELIGGALYSVPVNALEALANNPNIRYISPDRAVRATLDYATPTVGGDLARQYGWDGAGIGIAVIDSGVTDHADLGADFGSRIVYSQTFVGQAARDEFGHGTHVAGIATGNGRFSSDPSAFRTFRGVAPKANIVNLRVLDAKGVGTDSAVIAAIDRAIKLKSRYNIRVINLSLGRPVMESYLLDPLCQAAEKAWRAGIVVVAAAGNEGRNNSAGNDGYATIASPGIDPYVITVGAMKTMSTLSRADDLIASYSSKGPTPIDHIVKPDIVAPGNRIISLLAFNSPCPRSIRPMPCPSLTIGIGVPQATVRFTSSSAAQAWPLLW